MYPLYNTSVSFLNYILFSQSFYSRYSLNLVIVTCVHLSRGTLTPYVIGTNLNSQC